MSGHKIEDCTSDLYNIVFADVSKHDECYSLICRDGKCICMDNEQAGLLRKLLSEEDQICMPFSEERFFFQNIQNRSFEADICKQFSANKDIYYNMFFPNRYFPKNEEKLSQIISTYDSVSNLMDVIKSIPVIYMTNSLHRIMERDSLIYLCRYSPCAERYMSILFRAIICRTIGCCQRAETQEQKEVYVCELAKLLNRLEALLAQDNTEIVNQCINITEKYIDAWKKMNSKRCIALARCISYELQRYRKELECDADNQVDVNENGKYNKLYCILKKILETADISITALPELPFADFEDGKTDYDEVMDILDNVKSDEAKLAKIWSILSQIFWTGEDIPMDQMEKMKRLAGMDE